MPPSRDARDHGSVATCANCGDLTKLFAAMDGGKLSERYPAWRSNAPTKCPKDAWGIHAYVRAA